MFEVAKKMIITTAIDAMEEQVIEAKRLASELNITYHPRKKQSINFLLMNISKNLFVINKHRGLSYYEENETEIFFHPNMAFHRIKQLEREQNDSLVTACHLKEGMTFFDGTLGLGSDTLVASFVVGQTGKVVSVEKSFPLSVVIKEGLKFFAAKNLPWKPLIDALEIKNQDNLLYLQNCPANSFDVVYFDFMFNRPVEASKGIQVISSLAVRDVITEAHVTEAIRVAKHRVVVKSSYGTKLIEDLGFKIEKKNQKRHFFYGVIELKE